MTDVVVIGAGPAGALAALRAADLGAKTTLVSSAGFGGMAAHDGPVPVRALAHAARLMREARQLGRYGIAVGEPVLDYPQLLRRVRDVVDDVVAHSSLRAQIESAGVKIYDRAGAARFVDPHTVVTETGLRLEADKIIICVGGISRSLDVPGFHLTSTHRSALGLPSLPRSMVVLGGGATGVQIASIFNAFGSRVLLFERGPRILSTEDRDVSAAVAAGFRKAGMIVRENFGAMESFEKTPAGVRMNFAKDEKRESAEAELVVVAAGWVADTRGLNLGAAGVAANARGFVDVDEYLQTSAPHVFAAGDVTGRLMLVPNAIQDGFAAATNAVLGRTVPLATLVNTGASFTDPEYASVGLTETKARQGYDVVVSVVTFDTTVRTIIDGQKTGFCKLIVDRKTGKILGCHVVGERAVELAQVAAIAISSGMRVVDLVRIPLAFPTYTGNLAYAAAGAARQLDVDVGWQAHRIEEGEIARSRSVSIPEVDSSPTLLKIAQEAVALSAPALASDVMLLSKPRGTG